MSTKKVKKKSGKPNATPPETVPLKDQLLSVSARLLQDGLTTDSLQATILTKSELSRLVTEEEYNAMTNLQQEA